MSISALIWSTADLLRGDYKQSDYGKIILPFTLLRRLECVLEPTRDAVLEEYEARKSLNVPLEQFLVRKSNNSFYNISKYTLSKLMADSNNIRDNLESYITSFSANAREVFEKYEFDWIFWLKIDPLFWKLLSENSVSVYDLPVI